MNATHPEDQDNLSEFAQNLYPPGRTGRREFDEREGIASAKARQRLALGGMLRPFATFGSSFLSKVWQAIVAVVRRIAASLGVNAQIGDGMPADPMGAAATFTAEGNTQEDQDLVDTAARCSAAELAAKTQELSRRALDSRLLNGPGGQAYVALQLDELGSNLLASRQLLEEKQAELFKVATQVSARSGSSVPSALAYLEAGGPEAAELVKEIHQLDTAVKDAELNYCALAIKGIEAARNSGSLEMESLVRQKVEKHATGEMNLLICEEAERVVLSKCASQGVNLQKAKNDESDESSVLQEDHPKESVSVETQVGENAPVVRKLSRAERYASTDDVPAMVFDEESLDEAEEEAPSIHRMRSVT